jgi:Collagen triple helix repeat (20 copies)
MISKLHARLGSAGLVVAVIALVAALAGTAFAATKLNGTQKKEVEKIAKKYAGKPGKPGKAGTNGTNGSNGAKGDTGAKGDAGAPGSAGAAGAPGKSVVITGSAASCGSGGKSIEVEGSGVKQAVCNGEEGPEGSPWTAGGTLPPGKTETGTYLISSETGDGTFSGYAQTTISFPIPLAEGIPGPSNTLYVPSFGTVPADCENTENPGTAGPANPEAAPGFLCVFESLATNMNTGGPEPMPIFSPSSVEGAGVSGAVLLQEPTAPEASAKGSWAVTAPLATP